MEFAISGSSLAPSAGAPTVKLPQIPSGKKKPISSKTPPNLLPTTTTASSTTDVNHDKHRRPRANSLTAVMSASHSAAFPGEMLLNVNPDDSLIVSMQRAPARQTTATTSASKGPATSNSNKQPTGMVRAKVWSLDVENAFRFQLAGFRDREEYEEINGQAEYWEEIPMVKCLKSKKTGYFLYFRKARECEDKHLNKIKLYQYAES